MPDTTTPQLFFCDDDLHEARKFNRRLAWAPRFRIRNRAWPIAIQSLLRMSQLKAASNLKRHGITVSTRLADKDGVRVPLRLLCPPGPIRGVVIDVHGGGWAIGNAQMNDQLNAAMAAACGVLVVSVDYRLAGTTPLAGLLADCLAAFRWLLDGGLPEYADLPVFVVGESAGAHLAAATMLALQAWPSLLARVRGAVMYYGVYDLSGTPSARQAEADTLVLHGPSMVPSMRLLTPGLSDLERRAPALSPLYGTLCGFPPALMFAGERDPLRDDTLQMATRWRMAAEVELHLVPEAPHGFIRFPTRMATMVNTHGHAWLSARLGERG